MAYQFPVINHIDDLLFHIKDCDYLVASKKENGTTGVCYTYSDKDSFANEWERECRGITFDYEGHVISRTLHKFFNLNERVAYQVGNLDFTKVVAVLEKLDGSMISSCLVDNKIAVKSKNSFTSDVALKAHDFIYHADNTEYLRFAHDLAKKGMTPTFEYTSPHNRIVVGYDEEALTLLQVRDNVTGKYFNIHDVAVGYDIKLVANAYDKNISIDDLIEKIQNMTNAEGVIVMFEDGDMVKIKCPWYIGLHHSVTFLRDRDIAKLVLKESLDDFRGLVDLGDYDGIDMDKVDAIEHEILTVVRGIKKTVEDNVAAIRDLYEEDNGLVNYKLAAKHLTDNLKGKDKILFTFIMNGIRFEDNKRLGVVAKVRAKKATNEVMSVKQKAITDPYMKYYNEYILKDRWGLDQI